MFFFLGGGGIWVRGGGGVRVDMTSHIWKGCIRVDVNGEVKFL